jgi:cytoskeleton protein RodZ
MSDSEQPTPTASPQPALTLGQMLQNARVSHDLTLEQVAAELRIEVKQLNALEHNRFTEIGVPVFVKGYLKQYGQRLGLDVRDLLAAYYHQTDLSDVQVQPNRTIKLRDERQITVWFLAGIVLLAVVIGLAVWWWNGGNLELTGRNAASSATTPAPAPLPIDAAPPPTPPVEQAPTAPIEQQVIAPVEQAPVEAASVEPIPTVSEPIVDDAAETAAEADAIPPSDPVSLELTFNAESWAEVTDARGARLLRDLYRAGRQMTVTGEPPFDIVLGNANAVRLVVAGADYPIPTRGRDGERVSFRVDVAEE